MRKPSLLFLMVGMICLLAVSVYADCYDCVYYYKANITLKNGKTLSGYIVSLREETDVKNVDSLRNETFLIKDIHITNLNWYQNRRLPEHNKVVIVNEEDIVKLLKKDIVTLKEDKSFKRIEGTGRSLSVPSQKFVHLLLKSKPVAIHSWGDYNVGTLVSFNQNFKEDELSKLESEALLYNPDKEKEKLKYFADNDIFFYVKSGE